MNSYFEVGVRYDKTMEDGLTKKVTETYVVNADSFTEAEERIIREMKQYISGEFDVAEIDRAVFREVLYMGRDEMEQKKCADVHWYKCKVQFITIDNTFTILLNRLSPCHRLCHALRNQCDSILFHNDFVLIVSIYFVYFKNPNTSMMFVSDTAAIW